MFKYEITNDKPFIINGKYAFTVFPIPVNKTESEILNKKMGTFFTRTITAFDVKNETEWYYIIKDEEEILDNYKGSKRKQIVKGLSNCDVKKIDCNVIKKFGFEIFKKWNEGFGNSYSESDFISQLEYDEKSNNIKIDYFGIYTKEGLLIGYAKNYITDTLKKIAFYETIAYDPAFLEKNINYAVTHEMNKHYLNELKFDFITNGSRNLYHKTNIQDYLISKFNYRKAYCVMDIIYRKDIKILVNLLFPFRKFLRKIEKLDSLLLQEEIRRSFLE